MVYGGWRLEGCWENMEITQGPLGDVRIHWFDVKYGFAHWTYTGTIGL